MILKVVIICAAAIIIIGTVIVFLYLQNNIVDITNYCLKSDNIKDNIRIVHLSDLHSRPFKKALIKTAQLSPDFIAITGDYINDHCNNKDEMLEYGKKLLSIAPVYYITGNHERRLACFDELMQELENIGFNVLNNQIAHAEINSSRIHILGLDENQANFDDYKARKKGIFQYQDMSPYFRELDKLSGYKLILSHFPENFEMVAENNYSQYDFDLQLSGHAHGGQFILPFIGPVFSPGQGMFPKYARGSFGERPKLIVSRGLGNAEFPFRLFNHPEINVIDIHSN